VDDTSGNKGGVAANNGYTPLITAVTKGRLAAVKLLPGREDVNVSSVAKDEQTALRAADSEGHQAVAKLVSKGTRCRLAVPNKLLRMSIWKLKYTVKAHGN
jgi:hypothetical protein